MFSLKQSWSSQLAQHEKQPNNRTTSKYNILQTTAHTETINNLDVPLYPFNPINHILIDET